MPAAEAVAAFAKGGDAVIQPPLRRLQQSAKRRYRRRVSAMDGCPSPTGPGGCWWRLGGVYC